MNFKEEIIKRFGRNSTGKKNIANKDIILNKPVLSDNTIALSLYTYKGEIYIINHLYMDMDFSDYNIKDQELIFNSIMK